MYIANDLKHLSSLSVWLKVTACWCITLLIVSLYCYSHGFVGRESQPNVTSSLVWAFQILIYWLIALPLLLVVFKRILLFKNVWQKIVYAVLYSIFMSSIGFLVQLVIWWPVNDILYLAYQYLPKALIACSVILLIVKSQTAKNQALTQNQDKRAEKTLNPQLLVMSGANQKLIGLDSIIYIQSSGNYLEIFCQDKSYLYRATISSMAEKLEDCAFMRIHRQYLVNTKYVDKVSTQSSGQPVVCMSIGANLPVGRSYKSTLSRFKI